MRTTERIAKAASTPTTGFFATLRGLLHANGSGAPKPSLRRPVALVFAAALSVMAFTAAPALAAAPETPETGKATVSTATTATLEDGALNPHAKGEVGEYEYRFRVSETECEGERSTAPGVAAGEAKEAVPPVDLTELQPNAHYTFCLIERTLGGEYSPPSTPGHFETPPAPPTIVRESASHHNNSGQPLNSGETRLEGVVNPNNQLTECHFQYGEASVTEHEVSCEPKVLEGFGEESVAAVVGGLQPGSTYHYQIIAENGKGEVAPIVEQTVIPEEPPALPTAPEPTTTALTATSAMLHGVLNPLNKHEVQPGSYEFVYRRSASECQGTNPGTGLPENENATPQASASGHLGEKVEGEASGLLPGVTYTFCLLARDQAEEPVLGPPVTFTTPAVGPEVIGEESFSNAGSSSVTLHARIDPGGAPTTYFFEYGPSSAYGSTTPVESAGAGSEVVSVQEAVEGLAAETTYHFRVVASNAKATGAVPGADESFSTFPAGAVGLPDGRAYELVSPLNLGDATVLPGGVRAAADGSAVAFKGTAPPAGGTGVPGTVIGIRPFGTNVYLAQRAASGWTSADIQPPSLDSATYTSFSSDLSTGILVSEQPLTPGGPTGENGNGPSGLYTREDDGGYTLLAANASYVGGTADGSHILLDSEGGLYDSVGGKLEAVNVLPEGGTASDVTFGSPAGDLERVISTDGSRIFWSTVEGGPYNQRSKALYVRENDSVPTASTVQLDVSEAPAGEGAKEKIEREARSGGGQFWGANSEGTKVFFTDGNRLTANSTATPEVPEQAGVPAIPAKPDLYEYNFDKPVGERLTDLTVDTKESADAVGVLGTSEDGSYVYFAAAGALANTNATPQECLQPNESSTGGRCNIYVAHEGEAPKFVATVAAGDGMPGSYVYKDRFGDWASDVGIRDAYVTADGRHLVFESIEDLTGFNSEGGQEIYMYDFDSALSCVSCNPSGTSTTTSMNNDEGSPVEYAHSELPMSGSSTFALRDVSVDGNRVFFDSAEQLVSQNTGGSVKVPNYTEKGLTSVYEWERGGSGSCTREKGCVYLLSGGTSTDIAVFLDASENGDDVFFETRAQLVHQDQGETFEVYDARVGAPPASTPPACTGSGCQGVPGAPPIFATPSSVTFNGVGNFPPPPPPPPPTKVTKKTVKCPKSKKLSNGKCVKRQSKKATKKARKSNRASHDRRAK